MRESQSIQKLSNNIFKKVYYFLRSLFYHKSEKIDLENSIKPKKDGIDRRDFRKEIKISESKDNIVLLKQKFDNRMIDVKEIPIKEKIELLAMYKKQILQNKNRQKN